MTDTYVELTIFLIQLSNKQPVYILQFFHVSGEKQLTKQWTPRSQRKMGSEMYVYASPMKNVRLKQARENSVEDQIHLVQYYTNRSFYRTSFSQVEGSQML